jgi:hypothetical protein
VKRAGIRGSGTGGSYASDRKQPTRHRVEIAAPGIREKLLEYGWVQEQKNVMEIMHEVKPGTPSV